MEASRSEVGRSVHEKPKENRKPHWVVLAGPHYDCGVEMLFRVKFVGALLSVVDNTYAALRRARGSLDFLARIAISSGRHTGHQ